MESLDTRVGSSILVTGKIEGDGNVIVEGRVEGSINIKGDLQIDVAGQVKSSVQARNIYVMGILVGNAVASEKIELAPGGRMIGDVRTPRFLINEGAAYRGNVDMVDFEADAGEARRTARPATLARPAQAAAARPATPAAPAPARPAEPRRELPASALRQQAPTPAAPPPVASRPAPGASLYTPPPLPRPPEFLGSKKAIIIKKKANEAG
jgi:cytoskeletal protein CcmA (bactofilin family)